MNKKLLTINDLCAELGIGKNTAYKLCKQKRIDSLVLGRKIVIRRKDLNKFIDKMSGES